MDASLEISKEIIAVLRADSEINSFVEKRIYDVPPHNKDRTFKLNLLTFLWEMPLFILMIMIA